MPKVVIRSDRPNYVLDDDGNEVPVRPGEELPDGLRGLPIFEQAVHVGWSKNQFVELGVAQFEVSREIGEKGFYTSLDREGCNSLIRAVRQARDAAFGKDA